MAALMPHKSLIVSTMDTCGAVTYVTLMLPHGLYELIAIVIATKQA